MESCYIWASLSQFGSCLKPIVLLNIREICLLQISSQENTQGAPWVISHTSLLMRSSICCVLQEGFWNSGLYIHKYKVTDKITLKHGSSQGSGLGRIEYSDPQISLRLMVGIWASLGFDSAKLAILYLVRVNYACLWLIAIQVWGWQNDSVGI